MSGTEKEGPGPRDPGPGRREGGVKERGAASSLFTEGGVVGSLVLPNVYLRACVSACKEIVSLERVEFKRENKTGPVGGETPEPRLRKSACIYAHADPMSM